MTRQGQHLAHFQFVWFCRGDSEYAADEYPGNRSGPEERRRPFRRRGVPASSARALVSRAEKFLRALCERGRQGSRPGHAVGYTTAGLWCRHGTFPFPPHLPSSVRVQRAKKLRFRGRIRSSSRRCSMGSMTTATALSAVCLRGGPLRRSVHGPACRCGPGTSSLPGQPLGGGTMCLRLQTPSCRVMSSV